MSDSSAARLATAPPTAAPLPAPPALAAQPQSLLNSQLLARHRRMSVVCAGIAIVSGTAGLLGWFLGRDHALAPGPHSHPMMLSAALSLVLVGLALLLSRASSRGHWQAAGAGLAAATFAGGTALLIAIHYAAPSTGQLHWRISASELGASLGDSTALALSLLGLSILLIDVRWARRIYLADTCAVLALMIGVSAALSQIFVARFNGSWPRGPGAFVESLALMFAGFGVLTLRPESGLIRFLCSNGTGGMMLRRLLPLAFVLPISIALLVEWLEFAQVFAEPFDSLVFALLLIVVFAAVLFWNARSLDRVDVARRSAEHLLRDSRDQWEQTFNCMTEGVSYHDAEYNIVGANDALQQMLSSGPVTGMKCYQAVHGTACPPDYCPMRRTLETGKTEVGEFFEPRLQRYFSVRTDPLADAQGKVVRIVHVVQDITENRRAEEAMRRLASIVETSSDAILATNLEGRIISWNEGAERMYGYALSEVEGQPVTMLAPPHLHGQIREAQARIIAGERTIRYEGQRLRKDGTPLDVSLTVSPLYDADGKIVGSSAIARDITERRRAEEERARLFTLERQARVELEAKQREVEQLNAELEERVRMRTAQLEVSNRELEAFTYSASHDLRAPLRSIDGFSRILQEEHAAGLDAEGSQLLGRVRASSGQMGQLIDALLQLSRITRTEMRRETVNLSAMAHSIADALRQTAPARQVEFTIADGIKVEGDAKLLQIVLQNLLGNAFKFTSRRERAQIEFGFSVFPEGRALFVRDNGAGFDMKNAHKLFGAFQRLHASSEFEGSGIGLATVQRIVLRHGGTVWAQAEPQRGATFYFTLP